MNLENYTKEKLWTILVETVQSIVMYPTHKAYTRENILPANADVTPQELALRLNMSLGEAMVILDELAQERKTPA